jgi:hypothetical protein
VNGQLDEVEQALLARPADHWEGPPMTHRNEALRLAEVIQGQMDDLSDALTAVELAARDGGRVVNTLGEILARLVAHVSRERAS